MRMFTDVCIYKYVDVYVHIYAHVDVYVCMYVIYTRVREGDSLALNKIKDP